MFMPDPASYKAKVESAGTQAMMITPMSKAMM
jgi:hypothetical protein